MGRNNFADVRLLMKMFAPHGPPRDASFFSSPGPLEALWTTVAEGHKKKSSDGDERRTARAAMECGDWHRVKET
jgi:hypothetical protein